MEGDTRLEEGIEHCSSSTEIGRHLTIHLNQLLLFVTQLCKDCNKFICLYIYKLHILHR